MKKITSIFFILLIVAVLVSNSVLPVYATYAIEITDSSAALNQSLDIDFQAVGAGDELVQVVEVVNHTASVHAIYLKNVEVLNDSILLDALTFCFIGNNGNQLTLTRGDFNNAGWPEFFMIKQNASDSFTIKTTVSNISNAYQGLSCKIRYTFEIVNMGYAEEDGKSPQTGDVFNAVMPVCFAGCSLTAILTASFVKHKCKKEERL